MSDSLASLIRPARSKTLGYIACTNLVVTRYFSGNHNRISKLQSDLSRSEFKSLSTKKSAKLTGKVCNLLIAPQHSVTALT